MAETSLSLYRRLQGLLPYESRKWALVWFLSGFLGVATFAWATNMGRSRLPAFLRKRDATSTDPGLLVKGTRFESYRTQSGYLYPKIRTFYHEHPQKKKLPSDLPLLVFMHGLGGSAAQFQHILASMVNIAPCLAIDLPGCGRSDFEPKDDQAYTTTAFAELLYAAIDRFRHKDASQKIVLIGHSMGCSIAALLASSNSPLAHLCSEHVLGMIAICPRSTALSEQDLTGILRLNRIWSPILDLMRLVDRRGGVDSASVLRVVGKDADQETKKLQLRFNQQSRSAVFQKVLKGVYLQERATAEKGEESLLGRRVWSGLKKPLYLVAAEGDKLAPPKEAEQINNWLNPDEERHDSKTEALTNRDTSTKPREELEEIAPDQLAPVQSAGADPGESNLPAVAGDADLIQKRLSKDDGSQVPKEEPKGTKPTAVTQKEMSTKHAFALKTTVFPAPASHGLLYATSDVRTLCGFIEKFLAKYVDDRLSPGWQLQHLTTSGKWDVKNLEKWRKIDQCSEPIGGIFRVMKTMREVDEIHTPKEFVKKFGWKVIPDGVAMVVDISHDVPVYDKQGLENAGVEYHKLPTVSKQPPTEDEVEQFNDLIDTLRRSTKIAGAGTTPRPTIGLHCHYGFNRSGYFVVSYLVLREKWKLEDALQEFASKRPPGIKHTYFIDDLYARYATRMERRRTIVG
ncbi:mRNA-capping enzyme [Lecanosticta acicola]|uniref:mRNA-capping enzyme n=1 Tax=Lecanosticta acicola TaxID=111012 RepID=A0AAI8YP40_9PEZI|nr:mRNA-capping enzyme [Lecanosticta acicola]